MCYAYAILCWCCGYVCTADIELDVSEKYDDTSAAALAGAALLERENVRNRILSNQKLSNYQSITTATKCQSAFRSTELTPTSALSVLTMRMRLPFVTSLLPLLLLLLFSFHTFLPRFFRSALNCNLFVFHPLIDYFVQSSLLPLPLTLCPLFLRAMVDCHC